jgi:hypothetical protein
MTNMTIAVPKELHGRMKEMSEIRWSEVARKAFEAKIRELELVEKIVSKSKLTQKDVNELADMIDKEVWEETKKCA